MGVKGVRKCALASTPAHAMYESNLKIARAKWQAFGNRRQGKADLESEGGRAAYCCFVNCFLDLSKPLSFEAGAKD